MRFGSVCSGIEAASCAWEPLGWKAEFLSEIEPFPCSVLAHHYPNVLNLGDMTKFKEWDRYDIDVLVGGTPCQSFSVAGLRKGLADPRGNLMLTYLAIADKYRPRWLVWENVPGVLSSNGGKDFGTFLGGLGELGYGFAYRVFDAQYIRVESHSRAVPQRRRRVFVVGHFGDWRRAAAVLFERESLCGNPPPSRKAGEIIAPTLDVRAGRSGETTFHTSGGLVPAVAGTMTSRSTAGGGFGGEFECAGGIIPSISMCLTRGGQQRIDAESETLIPTIGGVFSFNHNKSGNDASSLGITEDRTDCLRADSKSPFAIAIQAGALKENANIGPGGVGVRTDGAAYTLEARAEVQAIAFDCKASGQAGFGIGDIASTMRSMGHANSHQNGGGHQAVMVDMQVRRLTPMECERLQGFPDRYTLVPVGRGIAKDGPRYKALGNSMAVNVMSWLGCRIQLVDELTKSLKEAA